jgi:hypothetical protein
MVREHLTGILEGDQPFPPLLALIPRTVWSVFTYAPH